MFCKRQISAFILLPGLILVTAIVPPASAETRGFVVSYYHTATHWDERNCPNGGNGGYGLIRERAYRSFGYSEAKTEELINNSIVADYLTVATRGVKDGKKVNVYFYPTSFPDPKHEIVSGPYAYGFDLDGSGPTAANSFQDPETGETGVDNQLFRTVGCYTVYRVNLPSRPMWEEAVWGKFVSDMAGAGAWLMTITGTDLSRDGKATVSFHRAVEYLRRNIEGRAYANMTYVVEPNSRTQAIFHGTIKNGLFVSDPENTEVMIQGAPVTFDKIQLSKARLRLQLGADGSANGYMAGYQPWQDFWYMVATGGEQIGPDLVGLFHNLKRQADATPDPETGENTAISATYRVESVPAFVARPDGTMITTTQIQP